MLAGSLAEFSIPDIFNLLASTRKTGVLQVGGPSGNGRVWIHGGAIVYAVADMTRSPLAARLLHGGEVDPDAIEPLVRAQASGDGGRIAVVLTDLGLAPDRSAALVREQIVDAVFDLSRWDTGDFAFDARGSSGDDSAPTVPVAEVLSAVDDRLGQWESILTDVPYTDSVLAAVSRPPLRGDGLVQMTPEQWEVFTLVDGSRTVGDVIAMTGQGEFVVSRLLASLVADGLVALKPPASEDAEGRAAAVLARLEHDLLGAAPPPPAADPSGRSTGAADRAKDVDEGDTDDDTDDDIEGDVGQDGFYAAITSDADVDESGGDGSEQYQTVPQAAAAGQGPTEDPAPAPVTDDAGGSSLDLSSLLRQDDDAAGSASPADEEDAAEGVERTDRERAAQEKAEVDDALLSRLIDGVKGV